MTDLNIIRDANALAAAVTELVAERDAAREQLHECREAAEVAKDEWEMLVDDLNKELAALHRQSVVVLPEDWQSQVHELGELCTPGAFISLLQLWSLPPAAARPVYPATDPELPPVAEEPPADPPVQAPPVDPLLDTVSDLPIVPAHEDVLACPNTPRCAHPGGAHVFTLNATTLQCGVSGCLCGTPAAADDGKPIGQEVTTDA
jgi:hypothetical protein